MLRQKQIRIGISDEQQRMAAEAARMAAAIAAVVADGAENDADDDDIRLSFEHLSPGTNIHKRCSLSGRLSVGYQHR
jgi:hypothetical protein